MRQEFEGGLPPTERAKEIARRVLDYGYDPLLACRDLAEFRGRLPGVADEIMDTFVGVASEVDDSGKPGQHIFIAAHHCLPYAEPTRPCRPRSLACPAPPASSFPAYRIT